MYNYSAESYDSEIFITFEFGVDDPIMTTDELADLHISYWSDDNAGTWCYVEHDSAGDYYAPVAFGDVKNLGLRIDSPVEENWTVAQLRTEARARCFKRFAKMKKHELISLLAND
jgi:hypothetical protein